MTRFAAALFRAARVGVVATAAGAILLTLTACQSAPPPPAVAVAVSPNVFNAGLSAQGRPIECHVLGDGPQCILIIASIHGDETAGTPLVRKLSHYLQMNPLRLEGRRVVLLPALNPDGMVNGTRENANGVDLNRNFPAANRIDSDRFGWGEFSEPESQAIAALIQIYWPSRIIVIHQPLACVDYDGPAQELAQQMADLSGLPLKKLGTRPGSMGAFFGEALEVPIITFELPRDAHLWNETRLWEKYGQAMIAAVVYPESVDAVLVGQPVKPEVARAAAMIRSAAASAQ